MPQGVIRSCTSQSSKKAHSSVWRRQALLCRFTNLESSNYHKQLINSTSFCCYKQHSPQGLLMQKLVSDVTYIACK